MRIRTRGSCLALLCCMCLAMESASQENANSSIRKHRKTYSALCIIAKDENRYIREWIEYHRCLGIGQIHIYDHESSNHLSNEFQADIDSGFITYRYFEGYHKKGFTHNADDFMTKAQGYAYQQCFQEFGDDHTFIGFIDVDEFLALEDPTAKSINDVLADYETYGAVSFHWRIIGPSGHEKRPAEPVVSSYTDCLPRGYHYHRQVKSFVNTKFQPSMISAHRAKFGIQEGNAWHVDELKVRLKPSMVNKPSWDRVSVYHYATKSQEDFMVKMQRGGAAGITRGFKYFDSINKTSLFGLFYHKKSTPPTPKVTPCMAAIETRRRLCPAEP